MKDIVIIGTGGFAKEVAFLIEQINIETKEWNILGFISNDEHLVGSEFWKYKIYNTDDWLKKTQNSLFAAFGIGDPKLIEVLSNSFQQNKNLVFPNLVHPSCIGDWDRINLDLGNIICAGNIFTTEIKVGSFNIFNLNCTIGHDSIIGSCNVFNPMVNISGGAKIKNANLIGTGAQILQNISISNDTIIGAGAVVNKNITEKGVYVGIPAKKIK